VCKSFRRIGNAEKLSKQLRQIDNKAEVTLTWNRQAISTTCSRPGQRLNRSVEGEPGNLV